MKIGILQTGTVPEALARTHGEYPDMFERLLAGRGFTFEHYPVVEMVLPGSVQAADGWLITGSRHGAYEPHPWIPPLESFIRDCHGAGVPMVGICFGHQIIAQALGGKVEKFPGGWVVGRVEYDFPGAGSLAVNAWHQDQVVERPEGAEVVASSPYCANAALVYDTRAFTVQPHPEFAPDFLQGLIETRGPGVVPQDLLEQATAELDRPLDTGAMADMIERFFKERRHV